jgi:succinate dehydrogenase hydrophobic anchor subunit
MAKVTSPLFSMGASGQLGKSLVYMTWKGIDDVRQYVIPANPRSALQVAQRGFFSAAVALWHATAFNAADKAAFNLWASQAATPRSGFNQFIDSVATGLRLVHTWNAISAIVVSVIAATTFHIAATGKTGDTYTGKIGLTPSTMNTVFEVTNTAGALTADPADLIASTTYYWYIDNTTASEDSRTGIVKTKTIAA